MPSFVWLGSGHELSPELSLIWGRGQGFRISESLKLENNSQSERREVEHVLDNIVVLPRKINNMQSEMCLFFILQEELYTPTETPEYWTKVLWYVRLFLLSV